MEALTMKFGVCTGIIKERIPEIKEVKVVNELI